MYIEKKKKLKVKNWEAILILLVCFWFYDFMIWCKKKEDWNQMFTIKLDTGQRFTSKDDASQQKSTIKVGDINVLLISLTYDFVQKRRSAGQRLQLRLGER